MRALLILGTVVLSAVPAAAASPLGNVAANTKVMRNGYGVGCRSALLIPRSPIADRNIRLVFGSLDRGAAKAAERPSLRPPGTLETACRLRTKGNYLFADIAPGEYYVVLRFTRESRTSDHRNEADFDGMLMRRATIRPGATARLRFD